MVGLMDRNRAVHAAAQYIANLRIIVPDDQKRPLDKVLVKRRRASWLCRRLCENQFANVLVAIVEHAEFALLVWPKLA